ncbi:hypothetical protein ScPMuIL_016763 [Solemya velum]
MEEVKSRIVREKSKLERVKSNPRQRKSNPIRRIRDVRTKNIHQSEKHRSNCDFAILADRGCASMERRKHGSSKPKPLDLQKAVESCKLGQDQDGFCVKFIDKDIGQGVFTTREFKPDEFLLEYAGELLSYKEASRRESSYTEVDGSFLFFFNAQNKVLCIDATFDPFELRKARFVNDGIGEEQNCRMVVVMVDKKPHLCLFSTKTIQIGDELRYDYGVPNLPWRKKKSTNQVDIEESAEADDLHVWKDPLHDAQDQVDIEESAEADDLHVWKDPLQDAQGSIDGAVADSDESDMSDIIPLAPDIGKFKLSSNVYSKTEGNVISHVADSTANFVPSFNKSEDMHVSPITTEIPSLVAADSTTAESVTRCNSLNVAMCRNSKQIRIWDKKNVCVYCNKLYAKLPRHLEQKHREELEVASALSFPKNSENRKLKWQELRNRGNFSHNRQVLSDNSGIIIPSKRPSKYSDVTVADFLPCPSCFAFLRKKDLWRHDQVCKQKCDPKKASENTAGRRHQISGATLLPLASDVNTQFKTSILNNLTNDLVSLAIRNDCTILKYGARLFTKFSSNPHQYSYVRQKLRELGRFLLKMREINKQVTSLSECCNPQLFNQVIEAVKLASNFDDESSSYDVPSLALKLGHSLKKCATIIKSTAIIDGNNVKKQEASDFLQLCSSEWHTSVSCQALQTLTNRKLNKPKRLPLAADIKKLNLFLEEKSDELQASLSPNTWREFAELLLAQIVLFNRRRGGETERMEVSHYLKGIQSSGEMQGEILESLSSFEKELAQKVKRVEINGKRGRTVAVLLTKKHCTKLDKLNQCRIQAGVSHKNKYVFARFGDTKSPIRSSDVLKKFCLQCGADKPELITSTSLRKHIATVSQILNLRENEMDSLANFLGHDIRIHRDFYRLPDSTFQVAKISKLLLELEKGTVQNFKGKTLAEIDIDPDDQVDIEESGEADDLSKDSLDDVQGAAEVVLHKSDSSETKRRKWSRSEKEAIERQLGKYFRLKSLPGKFECEKAKYAEPILRSRPWKQLKYFLKNHKLMK